MQFWPKINNPNPTTLYHAKKGVLPTPSYRVSIPTCITSFMYTPNCEMVNYLATMVAYINNTQIWIPFLILIFIWQRICNFAKYQWHGMVKINKTEWIGVKRWTPWEWEGGQAGVVFTWSKFKRNDKKCVL